MMIYNNTMDKFIFFYLEVKDARITIFKFWAETRRLHNVLLYQRESRNISESRVSDVNQEISYMQRNY